MKGAGGAEESPPPEEVAGEEEDEFIKEEEQEVPIFLPTDVLSACHLASCSLALTSKRKFRVVTGHYFKSGMVKSY